MLNVLSSGYFIGFKLIIFLRTGLLIEFRDGFVRREFARRLPLGVFFRNRETSEFYPLTFARVLRRCP